MEGLQPYTTNIPDIQGIMLVFETPRFNLDDASSIDIETL